MPLKACKPWLSAPPLASEEPLVSTSDRMPCKLFVFPSQPRVAACSSVAGMFGEVGPGAPDAAAHDGGFPFSSPAGPLRRPVPEEVPCLSPIRVAPPPGQNNASCHLMITPASSSPSRPPASSAHERLLHSSEAFSCLGTRSDENDRTPLLDTPTPDISPFDFSMSQARANFAQAAVEDEQGCDATSAELLATPCGVPSSCVPSSSP